MYRAVVVVLALSACGRFSFEDSDPTVFDEPQVIGELSTDFREADPTLTADELVIYFSSDRPGGMGSEDLWFATRADRFEPFDAPRPASELNSDMIDITPHLSADGLTIWFASRRANVNNVSILVATRTSRDLPFEEPVVAAPLIDTSAGEFSPSLYAGDQRMLYASDMSNVGTGGDIWESELVDGEWQEPVNRTDLNTDISDGAPAIFAGGRAVVFGRGDGTPSLFVASRDSSASEWEPAALIPELDSGSGDNGAWITDDGLSIYFNSNRGGMSDLYSTRRALNGL